MSEIIPQGSNDIKKKAIFLDRDGTLNYDGSYLYKIEDLKLLPGVMEGVKYLKDKGYLLIIVTNQSGVGRGYYQIEDVNKFNDELQKQLGITFDDIFICPHVDQDHCDCRKPAIKNLLVAKEKHNLDLSQCFFIGDKETDIECGHNAGCKTVYIRNNMYEYTSNIKPDYTVSTIEELPNILSS